MPRDTAHLAAASAAAIDFSPGGILALDLSRVTGWTYGHIGDRTPRFGTWHLTMPLEGARLTQFENVLIEALDEMQPARLVMEAPLHWAAATSEAAVNQQRGLRAIAVKEAYRSSIATFEIDAATVRQDVLGKRHFAKDTVKREVVRFCLRRGWKVPDHNSADSALLWLWYSRLSAGVRPAAGPLFADAIQ